jgi:hypothetical protein
LLEHELWLRAARDPEVAGLLRARDAEVRSFSARQLSGWTARVGARPPARPDELAVLLKALLTGLAMQRRLDPDSVSDELALKGLRALTGFDRRGDENSPTQHRRSSRANSTSSHQTPRRGARP